MSLKKYKTRIEFIGEDLDHSELNPFSGLYRGAWWSSSYWYDEEEDIWYDDDYDHFNYDYDFLERVDLDCKIIRKTIGGWILSDDIRMGSYIDMESVYDKVEKRNRRIDVLLGLNDKYTPTLGDLIKKNKKR
jgi:hypothetical protein